MKGKVYRTVVRRAVALRKRQEEELEVAELKMLRFTLGVTTMDRIWNETIRGAELCPAYSLPDLSWAAQASPKDTPIGAPWPHSACLRKPLFPLKLATHTYLAGAIP